MGEVYKATDTRLDRTVALKVLPAHISDNSELRQRFDREARTISSLNHPHICTLHDVGRVDGIDYLVMEYLEGETLAERLTRGALTPDEVFRIAVQIGDALAVAHQGGVVHRDLKPGNVILTRAGAKLLDFGLAKQQGHAAPAEGLTQTTPLTGTGTLLGTLQYMSPEQLEGTEADARSDIFAFGAILYEMTTGLRAFEGKSQASLIAAILEREPRAISELVPTSPPGLDRVLKKCLAKNPEQRWHSAKDLVDELRWIASGGTQAPATAQAKSRPLLAWAGWAVALVALAGLAALYLSPPGSSSLPVLRTIVPSPPDALLLLEGDNAGPPVISPDGQRMAFVAVSAAGAQVWVRELSELNPRALPGTEGASFPFWSPDSKSLGFFADERLKRVDIASAQVFTVCAAPNARGGTWGRGDVIVFCPNFQSDLFQVPAAGGTPTFLTQRDTLVHSTHRWPNFLPDGLHLLYLAGNHRDPAGPDNGVWFLSLDGKDNHLVLSTVTDASFADGRLLFVRDSVLFVQGFDPEAGRLLGEPKATRDRPQSDPTTWKANFSVSETGVLAYQVAGGKQGAQIHLVDRQGKSLRSLGPRGNHYNLYFARNEKGIVFSSQELPYGELYYFDLERDLRTRLTFGVQDKDYPVLDYASSRVAFSVDSGGPGGSNYEIHMISVDGSRSEVLVARDSIHDMWPFDWSQDGKYLLCAVGDLRTATASRLSMISADGSGYRLDLPASINGNSSARFSPDGRWIAFSSQQGSVYQVFVMPGPSEPGAALSATSPIDAGGSRRWQVSSAGGDRPRWRADGREIYYIRPDGTAMAVEVSTSGTAFQVGHETELFRAAMRGTTECWDPTEDGQRFVVNVLAGGSSTPIVVVQNWAAGL